MNIPVIKQWQQWNTVSHIKLLDAQLDKGQMVILNSGSLSFTLSLSHTHAHTDTQILQTQPSQSCLIKSANGNA